jgi:hypothetical protein
MKKNKDDNKFFGLNTSEKEKIIRKAVDRAMEEQVELINEYGENKLSEKVSQ